MGRPRIYFFSGMGSDQRLLDAQRSLDAEIIVLPWIPNAPDDTLATYAQKLATTIDTTEPFFLGGVSLGGMLAYEMGASLGPNLRGLILIVSSDSCRGIPWLFRLIGRIVALLPAFTLQIGKSLVPGLRKLFGISTKAQSQLFQSMLADADPRFLKWSLRAILTWPGPTRIPDIPTLWIHAGRDLIVPYGRKKPGVVVPDAGHTVNVTHAVEVNGIITDWLREQTNAPAVRYNVPYESSATDVE